MRATVLRRDMLWMSIYTLKKEHGNEYPVQHWHSKLGGWLLLVNQCPIHLCPRTREERSYGPALFERSRTGRHDGSHAGTDGGGESAECSSKELRPAHGER